MALHDIVTEADVKLLVDHFYQRVRADDLIGPIFKEKLGDHWDSHLSRMYAFWETILLEVQAYSGSPFLKHANLPISKSHFDIWLQLFNETVDKHFAGEKAEEAKWRAARMGEMFRYKLDYQKTHQNIPPLK